MAWFHALLDTKQKRELVFSITAFALIAAECFMNSLFLWRVIQIKELEELYQLVSLAKMGMFGRLVLAVFEAGVLSGSRILFSLIKACSLRFAVILILCMQFAFMKPATPVLKSAKRHILIAILIALLAIGAGGISVLGNLQQITYQSVLRLVQFSSAVLLTGQILIWGWMVLAIAVFGYRLLISMDYRAVEIMEEVSIEFVEQEEKDS